jgi:hypothetical protein
VTRTQPWEREAALHIAVTCELTACLSLAARTPLAVSVEEFTQQRGRLTNGGRVLTTKNIIKNQLQIGNLYKVDASIGLSSVNNIISIRNPLFFYLYNIRKYGLSLPLLKYTILRYTFNIKKTLIFHISS